MLLIGEGVSAGVFALLAPTARLVCNEEIWIWFWSICCSNDREEEEEAEAIDEDDEEEEEGGGGDGELCGHANAKLELLMKYLSNLAQNDYLKYFANL